MSQSQLVKYLPESVVFQRKPLSEEENAYGPWSRATKCLYIPPDEEDVFWSLVFPDPDTGEGMEYPTGKAADSVREILDKNRRAFELVDEGLARSGFQIPEQANIEEENLFDFGIQKIISFRLVNARRLLAEGDHTDAVREAVTLSRIGKMVESSSAPHIPILVFVIPGYRSFISFSKWFLADQNTLNDDLLKILALLRQQRETIGFFCEGLQNDLCYETLNELDRFPENAAIEELVDALLKEYYIDEMFLPAETEDGTDHGVPTPAVQADIDQKLAWRRDKILFLLKNHPCPFDKEETARQMGEQVSAMEASLLKALTAGESSILDDTCWPADRAGAELESWPQNLKPGWPVDFLGESPEMETSPDAMDEEAFRTDIIKMWAMVATGSDILPCPTQEELVEVKQQISSVANPLGNLIFSNAFLSSRQLCNLRLEINADAMKLEEEIEERLRQ